MKDHSRIFPCRDPKMTRFLAATVEIAAIVSTIQSLLGFRTVRTQFYTTFVRKMQYSMLKTLYGGIQSINKAIKQFIYAALLNLSSTFCSLVGAAENIW